MQYPFSRSQDAHVDLSSLDAFNDGAPFATFARLRREDPLAWSEMLNGDKGFWSVTRHADLLALNRQADLLSSAKGIRMEDQTAEEFEARKTFQETDAPHHRGFRALVAKAFAKSTVATFEDQIRAIVTELLDVALDEGEFDAVDRIARRLPMQMLAQIMGVPQADGPWLVEKGDALISNSDPDYTDFVVDQVNTDAYRMLPFRSPAAMELFDYANDLLDRMDAGEQIGVLNLVREPTSSGERMSRDEFRNFFCLLVAAGNDTTRYSISATIHALANNPALLTQLQQGAFHSWEAAADEMIRYASPTTHFRRTATRDFELHGRQVKAGDKVLLWFISGNRDENAIDRPYEIDLMRERNPFLSFGQGGPHICLGMWLAKLEVAIVMQELAKRLTAIEQVADHSYLRSNFIHGIKHLPVRVRAR
ncbi:cytochrome P450 [Novosphingobium piscinae]|uniref:Cytochrome P450 n=1 Tax=Novosphingobium piscinae TaxID=1507448 RepID=A0A7X1FYZ5_9SPHN|nr:cytochrome P450 [Novosphingobium piscinae]MBC2669558.1 cytochrome P450 [Novosphingobium piscinae]